MIRRIFPLIILLFTAECTFAQDEYIKKLQYHRDSTDKEFLNPESTILDSATLAHFDGLKYFETDKKFCVTAKFHPIKKGTAVKMKTSGAREPLYKPYGTLSFRLEGKKVKLTLYQSADQARPELKNYLLLAFTDLTTGTETYGGGRYIEYTLKDISEKMTIDFNYCFNPYCAYSSRFSCVIPPAENFINLRITAGVKKFHD
jgi:uncharacterized protein